MHNEVEKERGGGENKEGHERRIYTTMGDKENNLEAQGDIPHFYLNDLVAFVNFSSLWVSDFSSNN